MKMSHNYASRISKRKKGRNITASASCCPTLSMRRLNLPETNVREKKEHREDVTKEKHMAFRDLPGIKDHP